MCPQLIIVIDFSISKVQLCSFLSDVDDGVVTICDKLIESKQIGHEDSGVSCKVVNRVEISLLGSCFLIARGE